MADQYPLLQTDVVIVASRYQSYSLIPDALIFGSFLLKTRAGLDRLSPHNTPWESAVLLEGWVFARMR